MAAENKSDLLAITQKEFAKLCRLTEPLEAAQAGVKDAEGISIKDVIGHRAHWITLFLGWYWDGRAGKDVFFPAKGYKWNDLKRYNAALRDRQAGLSWDAARALLEENHEKLLKLLNESSENDLYGHPMQMAKNHWTTGRWAEAAGASHYRSAHKYIRTTLRQRNRT